MNDLDRHLPESIPILIGKDAERFQREIESWKDKKISPFEFRRAGKTFADIKRRERIR